MPAPIALSPLAWAALRYGAVTALAYYATRNRTSEPKDVHHDAALNDLPEGLRAHRHRAEGENATHAAGRLRRTVRLGRSGPGVEIDASAIGRLRFRRGD